MARQIVIAEDQFEAATQKLDQARNLAELLSNYRDVNLECEAARRSAAGLIVELTEAAQRALEAAQLQATGI